MLINNNLLDELSAKARANERKRMNLNLHKQLDEKVQRLLNALEPGTILPIHRHPNTDETYFVVRGALKLYIYDNDGNITESHLLDPCDGEYGYNIPAGTFHTVEVLERGCVIFEVKEGPYSPLSQNDILVK